MRNFLGNIFSFVVHLTERRGDMAGETSYAVVLAATL
jgi:hypothetical protein